MAGRDTLPCFFQIGCTGILDMARPGVVDTLLPEKNRSELFAAVDQCPHHPQCSDAEAAAPGSLIYDDQYFHVKLSVAENRPHITLSKW